MANKQYSWQTIQIYIWLVLAVVCLFAALIFWAITDRDTLTEINQAPETEIELQIQPEKVAAMTQLGAMTDDVKPLDMKVRVAIAAQHEAEFRGTKFIQDNKNSYSIELFRVSNEDIVKAFLRKQTDRKPFIYIRLSGEDQLEQYVVLYQTFSTEMQAQSALNTLNLKLAESLKPQVIALKNYAGVVNDLGSDELNTQKIYAVKLKPAAVPVVDEVALLEQKRAAARRHAEQSTQPEQHVPTTATTVTRRDASGNVVDVQQSQSHSANPAASSAKPVQDVIDPFN
jgi:peptidyl-tRNA hydrolase